MSDVSHSLSLSSKIVSLDLYRASHAIFDWKKNVERRLSEIQTGTNLDYETAIPSDSVIFDHARSFIAALPQIIESPVIGINDEGTLLLEWHKIENDKHTIFSLIFDGENMIFALMNMGASTNCGALSFSSDSIDIIKNLLLKYFEISTHDKRATR